jgi:multimeric flavodoxin WrbA
MSTTARKVTAIIGTYRKNGAIDRAVEELLEAARSNGAEVTKFDLRETHVEFWAKKAG